MGILDVESPDGLFVGRLTDPARKGDGMSNKASGVAASVWLVPGPIRVSRVVERRIPWL